MHNEFENSSDLKREELLNLASRFTIEVVDGEGKYKGNAFIVNGQIISAHHVVEENYSIDDTRVDPETVFVQVGDQDIAESLQKIETTGFRRATNEGDKQEVFLMGRDEDNNPLVVAGVLMTMGPVYWGKMEISVDRKQLDEVRNGMSGSAVTNKNGEAIGVLVQARMGGKGLIEPFR